MSKKIDLDGSNKHLALFVLDLHAVMFSSFLDAGLDQVADFRRVELHKTYLVLTL